MEKVYEFKKGEKIGSDTLKADLMTWFTFIGESYEDWENTKDSPLTVLKDFTITIKIDYKDNH